MNRHIKFLEYLEKTGGDIESKNVTKKLVKLGLSNEGRVYDFLESLKQKRFIEWEDNRPRVRDFGSGVIFMGGIPDENAPFSYTAKITIEGLDFLREDNFKYYNKTTAIVAAFIALLAIIVSVYFGISSSNKEQQVEQLQQVIYTSERKLKAKSDSILYLNAVVNNAQRDLLATRLELKAQLQKDSIEANKATNKGD